MKKVKLQEMRLKYGINQDAMATLVDMTQATYSRKERGLTSINDSEWDKLASVLKVNKYEIYENDTKESMPSGVTKKAKLFIPEDLLEKMNNLEKENLKLKRQIEILNAKLKKLNQK